MLCGIHDGYGIIIGAIKTGIVSHQARVIVNVLISRLANLSYTPAKVAEVKLIDLINASSLT